MPTFNSSYWQQLICCAGLLLAPVPCVPSWQQTSTALTATQQLTNDWLLQAAGTLHMVLVAHGTYCWYALCPFVPSGSVQLPPWVRTRAHPATQVANPKRKPTLELPSWCIRAHLGRVSPQDGSQQRLGSVAQTGVGVPLPDVLQGRLQLLPAPQLYNTRH